MFRVKRGPVLLWTVTTAVARTNERAAGITGANPVTIRDYYHVAVFEVAVTAQTNLVLADCRIFGRYTATAFDPPGITGQVFALPVATSLPLMVAGQGALCAGAVRLNTVNNTVGTGLIVPPNLLLEYTTGAAGATPVLTFQVRAFFVGSPFYAVDP